MQIEKTKQKTQKQTHTNITTDIDKGAIQWRKDNLFNKWCILRLKKKKNLDLSFIPYTKINSKQITDIKSMTIRYLGKNVQKSNGEQSSQMREYMNLLNKI